MGGRAFPGRAGRACRGGPGGGLDVDDEVDEVVQERGAVLAPPRDGELDLRRVLDVAVDDALELEGAHPGGHHGHPAAGGHEGQQRGRLPRHLGDPRLEAGLAAEVRGGAVEHGVGRVGDELLVLQLVHGHGQVHGEGAEGGQRHHERLAGDHPVLDVRRGHGRAQEGGVEGVLPQPLLHGGGQHLAVQRQGQPGHRLLRPAHDPRHHPVGGRAGEADPQHARGPLPHLVDVGLEGLDLVDDPPPAVQEHLAGGGEVHPPGGPVQQPHAELLLELADLLGQRRLGHVQALGGAAEVALLGHGDEVVELPDLHRGTWPFRSVGGVVVDRHPSY
jgi:hypothetical protein